MKEEAEKTADRLYRKIETKGTATVIFRLNKNEIR